MHNISTLNNGLTLITVNLPHLDSVTSLVAVGAGSRYEIKKTNGISHFLEHMFFKGSRKYPTAEQIAILLDGIGSFHNAGTSKELTVYWVKSATKHLALASDIISSILRESLFVEKEVEREKGVIVEELRMSRDNPQRYIWDLYEMLQFGDQPLGWDIGGDEKTVMSITRDDLIDYVDNLYSPKNMILVYAGNFPKNIEGLAQKLFGNLPQRSQYRPKSYIREKQTKPKINVFYKKNDQANIILGVESYSRNDKKKYAAEILQWILGAGMSSRLFIQVREKRGLAYRISAQYEPFIDTGISTVYAGLKLEKIEEGLQVILAELQRIISEKVTDEELKKAKEMIRGRLAISSESTNFLAEYFGTNFVLDRKIETFDEYLKNIDAVTVLDIQKVAEELFQKQKYNLQLIGPFKSKEPFEKILNK